MAHCPFLIRIPLHTRINQPIPSLPSHSLPFPVHVAAHHARASHGLYPGASSFSIFHRYANERRKKAGMYTYTKGVHHSRSHIEFASVQEIRRLANWIA